LGFVYNKYIDRHCLVETNLIAIFYTIYLSKITGSHREFVELLDTFVIILVQSSN
jgi:hypothetical protein